MTRLFTYQPVDNIDKHKVINAESEEQAQELIDSGKAVKLDMPELKKYEQKASELHANYKKEVEKIKESDNPLMTDEVKRWEIGKLDESYEAETTQLEQEYTQWRKQQQEEAKARAARAVVKVTKDDEQVASQFVTRASLNLATASDNEKGAIVSQLVRDIEHLSDSEKTAMQSQIGGLLNGLEQRHKNMLVSAAQDVRNGDLLAAKVAEQLPTSVLTEKRMYEIAKNVVGNTNNHTGGIDREFYEKYLKAGDK